jgi:putative DNA primase/helicase
MLGAQRLMQNDKFTLSSAHQALMAKWRRSSNSLEEFIFESCEVEQSYKTRCADFYNAYKVWCGETGRHSFAKSNVRELLDNNIGLGICFARLDGYDIYRGVRLKSEFKDLTDPRF